MKAQLFTAARCAKTALVTGCLVALGTAYAGSGSKIEPPQPASVMKASAKLLKDNFFRAFSVIDPITLEQPPTANAQALIRAQGFSPRTALGVEWSATAVDAERVKLCLKVSARQEVPWRTLVQKGLRLGWAPADSSCVPTSAKLPEAWPVMQAFTLILDRRDVPQSFNIPEEPILGGLDGGLEGGLEEGLEGDTPPSLPPSSFKLSKKVSKLDLVNTTGTDKDFVTIAITNTAKKPKKGEEPKLLNLIKLTVREGFVAQHTCVNVPPKKSCVIQVRYARTMLEAYTGALEGQFSNGERFRIQLTGRVAKGKGKGK